MEELNLQNYARKQNKTKQNKTKKQSFTLLFYKVSKSSAKLFEVFLFLSKSCFENAGF